LVIRHSSLLIKEIRKTFDMDHTFISYELIIFEDKIRWDNKKTNNKSVLEIVKN